MQPKAQPEVTIRPATPADGTMCGQICYEAFNNISTKHGFPPDFPAPEMAVGVLSAIFANPHFFCVVAESGGRIVGSNCLDERSMIAGIGPITIDPAAQNLGVGRKLMQAVMDRANQMRPAGMRLVQAAFHNRSLSLYTSLGFDIREPLSCVQGRTLERSVPGCSVRPAKSSDLSACNALSRRIHGFDRSLELEDGIKQNTALIVQRAGCITGYASALAFSGHATAESNLDLQALIASVESPGGPGILVPSRNTALLRWCLLNGLKIVQPLTLMSIGLYNDPPGAWLPSILF